MELSYTLTSQQFKLKLTEGNMEVTWVVAKGDDPESTAATLKRFVEFYYRQDLSSTMGPVGGVPAPVAAAERPEPEALGASPVRSYGPPPVPADADYELIPAEEQSWE